MWPDRRLISFGRRRGGWGLCSVSGIAQTAWSVMEGTHAKLIPGEFKALGHSFSLLRVIGALIYRCVKSNPTRALNKWYFLIKDALQTGIAMSF